MEPFSNLPTSPSSFSHSHTSPSKHPDGPRPPSIGSPKALIPSPDTEEVDELMEEEFTPSGLLPTNSAVPSPPRPASATLTYAPTALMDEPRTTSPYFATSSSSNSDRRYSSSNSYGSKHTTIVQPHAVRGISFVDDGLPSVSHVENAGYGEGSWAVKSPMDQDGLPDYIDTTPAGPFDDKSQAWDASNDYRSPEALPPSPPPEFQHTVQEDVAAWTKEREAASWERTMPGLVNDPSAEGWGTPPPPLISVSQEPLYAQVGPGVLPSVLIEAPAWPIRSPAWEIIVETLPSPSIPITPLPQPPTTLVPTAESLATDSATIEGSTPSSINAPLPDVASAPPKIDPPTLDEIRSALPSIPSGGSVLFCPSEMSWWVFPAGQGHPPHAKLTSEAVDKVTEFAVFLADSRKGTAGMDRDGAGGWNEDKKAPHLHLFENAIRPGSFDEESNLVSSSRLGTTPRRNLPPALPSQLDADAEMESPHPSVTIGSDDTPTLTSSPSDPQTPPSDASAPFPTPVAFQDEPALLEPDNLYISANDSTWVVMPRRPAQLGVLNPEDVAAFSKSKAVDPPAGVTDGVDAAWTVILSMIANFLFAGRTDAVKVTTNQNFAARVGWDENSRAILSELGFQSTTQPSANGDVIIVAPSMEPAALLAMRSRLLRAWVEVGAYLEDHRCRRRHRVSTATHLPVAEQGSKPEKHAGQIRLVQAEDGKFGETTGLKALPKRDPRLWSASSYENALQTLGLNIHKFQLPSSFVIFAYKMQTRFDAVNTPRYLEAVSVIEENWNNTGKDDLQTLLVTERSSGLYTSKEIEDAYEMIPDLSKAKSEEITVPQDQFPHDYITKSFWTEFNSLGEKHGAGPEFTTAKAELIHALEVIAVDRRSDLEVSRQITMVVEQARREPPTPEEAYLLLGVHNEVDDEMLLALYDIRISDQPNKIYEWRDALRSIANARNSETLRKYSETGQRPADVVEVEEVSEDRPVGLNNVGNTCYLNSLLQYFYTIKELRETVSNCSQFKEELKDDLEKRVGGRAVSRKEIERSIRFTDYLATLFSDLEMSDTPSVSPELELAYLALVTSKDEEADVSTTLPSNTTGTSPDTDATLVDDSMPPPPPPSNSPVPLPILAEPEMVTSPTSATVLGKRTSEDRDLMDVDSQPNSRSSTTIPEEVDLAMDGGSDHSSHPSVSPAVSPLLSPLSPGRKALRQDSFQSAARSTRAMTIEPEANIPSLVSEDHLESSSSTPLVPEGLVTLPTKPSLPPRPISKPSADGPMMFGKQHDVSECLDNCLFQIEAAMDPMKLQGSSPGGANLVKQLFYGKARQTLHFEGDLKASAAHDKEVIFNHILLNVGETGTSKDLYDGLSDYYTPELVDIDGKKASIEEIPVEFPRLLHVQLQRAQFDRETSRAYKSNAFVRFPETLQMDRYSEEADPVKRETSRAKTTEIKNLRERVDALKNSGKRPYTEALATLIEDILPSSDWLPSAQLDEDFKKDLDARRGQISMEFLEAEMNIKTLKGEVEEIWQGDEALEYELASVFMHRGDASFGHYFLYQRNLPKDPSSWFKYNDAQVTKVTSSEVLADTSGTNANPYLLVYARKDLGLVDTVKRTLIT